MALTSLSTTQLKIDFAFSLKQMQVLAWTWMIISRVNPSLLLEITTFLVI
ncbi:MAG: hypothetical protein CM15mP60_1530 [Alphaproteobacteria bacterium]|nr:MAG: hypothetical protein CM15mP60_1530 [Alphaproteobacteria bacterium]